MSIFWDQLFGLLIILIAALLFAGVYREISRRLSGVAERLEDPGTDHGSRGAMVRRHTGRPGPVPEELPGFEKPAEPEKKGWLRNTVAEAGGFMSGIFRALSTREVLGRIAVDMLVIALVSALLAIFAGSTIGGLDIYMSTFLPMLGVMLALFAFTEAVNGSRVLAVITGILILTGVLLQSLLKLSKMAPSASELVTFAVISMCAGIIGCFFLRMFAEKFPRKVAMWLLGLAVAGIYAVLFVFGKEVAGTTAWLIVGGFSFQLTELTKVMTLLFYGLVFTDQDLTPDKRLVLTLIILAVNGVALLLLNELGTLCILGLAFFLMGWIYLPDVRKLVALALVLVLLASLVLGLCFLCNKALHPAVAPEATETTAPAETTAPTEAAEATEATAPAETTPATEPAGGSGEEKEEKSLAEKAISLGDKIWRKFKLRVDLVLHPDTVDPLDGGYQTAKAQNALSLSTALGSRYEVDIPVVQSDYIFTFLVLKMGVVYALIVLMAMLLMLVTGLQGCLANPKSAVAAVGVAFTLGMVIQSLIAAASATGAFIVIGLPFSFLSDGGTAAVTNYMMAVFIIYATGGIVKSSREERKQTEALSRKERV